MERQCLRVIYCSLCLCGLFFLFSCSQEKAKTSGETGPNRGEQSAVSLSGNKQVEVKSPDISSMPSPESDKGPKDTSPVVKKARIIPETQNNSDILRVVAEGQTDEGKSLSFKYEWTKNNEYAGDGDSISNFKKGDKIAIKITPFDGQNYGQPRILTAEIKKSTPKLTESNQVSFDGKVLLYQVKAVSPDGDPITYSLIYPPQGMDIDKNSGLIKWVLPENALADQSVKVRIQDNSGGELLYTLNIALGKK